MLLLASLLLGVAGCTWIRRHTPGVDNVKRGSTSVRPPLPGTNGMAKLTRSWPPAHEPRPALPPLALSPVPLKLVWNSAGARVRYDVYESNDLASWRQIGSTTNCELALSNEPYAYFKVTERWDLP